MERSQSSVAGLTVAISVVLLVTSSCVNPFAPALRGNTESLWTDASTVGGLMQNFETAYELADSMHYAEVLDEDFQFEYYDPNLQRTDGWYRETDLQATARMFRSFHNISLIWIGLSEAEQGIATADSLVRIDVGYQLNLDELSALIGPAQFTLYKPAGGRFKLKRWRDGF